MPMAKASAEARDLEELEKLFDCKCEEIRKQLDSKERLDFERQVSSVKEVLRSSLEEMKQKLETKIKEMAQKAEDPISELHGEMALRADFDHSYLRVHNRAMEDTFIDLIARWKNLMANRKQEQSWDGLN